MSTCLLDRPVFAAISETVLTRFFPAQIASKTARRCSERPSTVAACAIWSLAFERASLTATGTGYFLTVAARDAAGLELALLLAADDFLARSRSVFTVAVVVPSNSAM